MIKTEFETYGPFVIPRTKKRNSSIIGRDVKRIFGKTPPT
jgi:hypothetical protein